MQQIISANDPIFNSYSSESTSTTTNLPSFHLKLLVFYYMLRVSGIDKPDYSLLELASRFKRSRSYISTCLAELEYWGFLASDPHGRGLKKRWITYVGFEMLENQPQHQIQTQIKSIPYIDLSEKELINSKILEQQQICEQLDDPTLETDTKLSIFLEKERISPKEQVMIKSQFRASPIGPVRKERVLNRVIAQSKKRLIGSSRKYFSTCLAKEEKEIKSLCHILRGKISNINLYSQL
jgi:hypothetical protein